MIEKTYNLMGGEVYVFIEAKSQELEAEILEFTYKTLIELISIFNFYDKNSILSKLNQKREVPYNNELAYVLKTSLNLYKTTKGHFNIFLGNETLARKINQKENKKTINKKTIKIPRRTTLGNGTSSLLSVRLISSSFFWASLSNNTSWGSISS